MLTCWPYSLQYHDFSWWSKGGGGKRWQPAHHVLLVWKGHENLLKTPSTDACEYMNCTNIIYVLKQSDQGCLARDSVVLQKGGPGGCGSHVRSFIISIIWSILTTQRSLAQSMGDYELVLSDHKSFVDMTCMEGTCLVLTCLLTSNALCQIMPWFLVMMKATSHSFKFHLRRFTIDGILTSHLGRVETARALTVSTLV